MKNGSKAINGLLWAAISLTLLSAVSLADTIVLKGDQAIEAEKVYEQEGNIYFYLHGLKMRVSKNDVLRIVETKEAETAEPAGVKENTAADRKPSGLPPPAGKIMGIDLLSAEAPSDAQERKDRPEIRWSGFRDFHWAAGLSALGRLKELESGTEHEELKEYVRVREDLKLGEARLDSIVYTFWRHQLFAVNVRTTGQKNYLALREEIFKRFGVGLKNDQNRECYLWSDPYSDRELKYGETDRAGLYWMRSKELFRRYQLSRMKTPSAYSKAMEAKVPRTDSLQNPLLD